MSFIYDSSSTETDLEYIFPCVGGIKEIVWYTMEIY
jgi:hypothetical protein